MPLIITELLVAVSIVGGLIFAFYVGSRLGRVHDDEAQHLGVIQGATLGLIGLLISFCFSAAMSRFVERQDILVAEANAIGTASLRADLLPPDARARLRDLLRRYTMTRIELTEAAKSAEVASIQQQLVALQGEMWAVAVPAVEQKPAMVMAVLPPLNELFDLLSTRNAATRRHMPLFTLTLVGISVVLSAGLLGYGQGLRRRPIRMAAIAVVVLIAAMVWATIDMDFPQRGLIQISNEPLQAVLRELSR
jgi:hypothetical protein